MDHWTDDFSIYSLVYRQKYPDQTEQLAIYMHVVRNITQSKGNNWYYYTFPYFFLYKNKEIELLFLKHLSRELFTR